jgi:hypothetical protein
MRPQRLLRYPGSASRAGTAARPRSAPHFSGHRALDGHWPRRSATGHSRALAQWASTDVRLSLLHPRTGGTPQRPAADHLTAPHGQKGLSAALLHIAGSGAHENSCGKGALPTQHCSVCHLRRRPCGRSDRAKRSRGWAGPDHPDRGEPRVPCRAGGRLLSRLHRRGVATPDCCSHAPPAARDVCAAPLAPGHPCQGGQALDRSAAADALPLEAALLHLDTDFELHRLSHGPGDAAVARPTTRRVLVVLSTTLSLRFCFRPVKRNVLWRCRP